MVDLNQCKKQKSGTKLFEPNENLSKEYLRNAGETLLLLIDIDGKSDMRLTTMRYYFEYFCIYSMLTRIGIKCGIHDYTIKLSEYLSGLKIIPEEFIVSIKKDKNLKVDNQYYLKNKKGEINYDALTDILLKTKEIISKLTEQEIKDIRIKI